LGGAAFVSFSGAEQDGTSSAPYEENKMVDMRKYLGKHFLKVDDLKASGSILVRITEVSEGRYDKPDLTFNDGTQLSLNTTNCRILAREYGMESEDWLGKELKLGVGKIPYGGELQESIVIKPISPSVENKASPEPEFGDDIDF
jgi:hypothetical protein